MQAAARALNPQWAARFIVALQVATGSMRSGLRFHAALLSERRTCYEDSTQTTDEEVRYLLHVSKEVSWCRG